MKLAKLKKLRAAIEKSAESLDDATALSVPELFPAWKPGKDYAAGDRLQHGGILYRVRQAHASQDSWTPDLTPALYEVVSEEDGTREHPISYVPGKALEAGKYYAEGGVVYVCTRDTGVPVYNTLADLAGIYVEAVG